MTELEPLGDRVIVKTLDVEDVTVGGVIIPEAARERPQRGRVVAAGPETTLNVEDEILYSKYGGTEISVDDNDLLVLRESDVMARVRQAS